MDTAKASLKLGSKVQVKDVKGHPVGPVGTVVMFLNDSPDPSGAPAGGVVVRFPDAGAEVHSSDELHLA